MAQLPDLLHSIQLLIAAFIIGICMDLPEHYRKQKRKNENL